jgi:hypothetical protein
MPIYTPLLKLCTNDSTNKNHPSVSTNTNILNGNETITGGKNMIPTESKIEATTKSMTMNGR